MYSRRSVVLSLSHSSHHYRLCTPFTRRLPCYSESRPGVGFPSTCCFKPQSALLVAKFTTVVISAVQGAGGAPTGATHSRSRRPQILHSPFQRSGNHTSHVLQMEDVRRKLICSCLEQTFSWLRDPTSPESGSDGRHFKISQPATVDCKVLLCKRRLL